MVVLAGIILAGAFAPLSWWPLAPLAFAILISKLKKSPRPIFDSFIFGLVAHLIILLWSKSYVGVPPYLALAVVQALFSLPLGIHFKMRAPLAFLPFTFITSEFLRAHIPFGGFGRSNVGYTQVDAPYAHLASIGGVYLLSALVIACACARNRLQWSLLIACIIASFFITNPSGGERISAVAIQGGQVARTDDFYTDIRRVFARHFALSKKAPQSDVMVWPENVVDGSPDDREFAPYFKTLEGRALIVGATPMIKGSPENQSVFIDSSGAVTSVYRKQSLVPFGEYMPVRTIVQHLNSHVNEVRDFRPGNNLILHSVKSSKLAPIICFEIIDDSIVRTAAAQSDAFVSQTNSATFHGSAAAQQQFSITRVRAMEFSRPIISAATVGITGFIDNNGRVLQRLEPAKSGFLFDEISTSSYRTLYARFPWVWLIFAVIFAGLGRLKRT